MSWDPKVRQPEDEAHTRSWLFRLVPESSGQDASAWSALEPSLARVRRTLTAREAANECAGINKQINPIGDSNP